MEDGVESDGVWVRVGSIFALRNLQCNLQISRVIWKGMFRSIAMFQDNWRDDRR